LRPLGRNGAHRSPNHEGFPVSSKDLGWDDLSECAAHQRAALAWPDQLFRGNCKEKFKQSSVQKGITLFVVRGCRQWSECELPLQATEHEKTSLKAWLGPEKAEPAMRAMAREAVRSHEIGIKPICITHGFPECGASIGEELLADFPKQMQEWFSTSERPDLQLTGEVNNTPAGKEVRKLWYRGWNAARDLVSAEPGK
jgi:hypothetical protein